jgi:DNA repair protein RecO (recombination protein O)
MKQIVTSAIVLKRINYQEADRIITVITKTDGKITLLAKGVRKPKSKLAGGIELLSTNEITFIAGKGEINTLISARLEKNYDNIIRDLSRTQSAYEFIKLINKSIENDAGMEFYSLLESAFEYLNDQKIGLDVVRIWFGLQFLQLMGHSPSNEILIEEAEGSNEKKNYRFDLDKMSFAPSESGSYSPNHLKFFRLSLINEPVQLQRVVDINKFLPQTLSLVQALMVTSGFNKV